MFLFWHMAKPRRDRSEAVIGFEQLERRTAPSGMLDVFAGSALLSMPDALVPPTLDRAAAYAADLPADEQFIANQRPSRLSTDSSALLSPPDTNGAADGTYWSSPPEEDSETAHRRRTVASSLRCCPRTAADELRSRTPSPHSANAWPTSKHQP